METVRTEPSDKDPAANSSNPLGSLSRTLNPTDLPSRDLSQLEFSVNWLWHQGPEWLPAVVYREKEYRPEEESCSLAMSGECVNELKEGSEPTQSLLVAEA